MMVRTRDLGDTWASNQGPDAPSEQGQSDADHPVADAVGDHVAIGQQAKLEVALEQALGHGREARDREHERQATHHRREVPIRKNLGDERRGRPDDRGDQELRALTEA